MKINEIFYSLQGEGALTGVPSVFVRLAGCPLRCKWCDTKYALEPKAGQEMSVEEVVEKVREFPTNRVVVTGGEPLVGEGVGEFLTAVKAAGAHVTVETAGIEFVADLPCDLMSISPKMSNSTPEGPHEASHEQMRFNLEALQGLINNYNYQLKFVVDTAGDLDEIAECLEQLENVDPYKIFLMPQVSTAEEYLGKCKMLAEICKQTGFAMSQRLQVLLWQGRKGT